jgi:hypothetical protein
MYTKHKKYFAAYFMVISMGVSSGSAQAGGFLDLEFSEAVFSNPTIIDNPYWPLLPGGVASRTFTYVGDGEDECVINTIAIVQGDVKMDFMGDYAGSTAQVVLDQEWVFEEVEECVPSLAPDDTALKEKTFDWYMQDDQKNIWYLGEHSRSFEDDCPPPGTPDSGTPDECFEGSWEAGKDGGEGDDVVNGVAGIVVPSDEPVTGEPLKNGAYYMQEVAFEAEDMAKILQQHASLEVEDGIQPGEYQNCRKAKEWTALEPGGSVEHKWYCTDGTGLVLIEGIGGGPTEQEVLVEMTFDSE